ncbi:RluA family pseudouridine synthase [Oceanobacillus sp. AG]|uniref:RluA family pseudouridine synthase n=1 Tax=Oceanobacillus sp. AG TaxID=2681969 RepID=UPI0012EB0D99|nr:RluA family pseudouridine synthase [Oceanobacillus sp. AG]
MDLKILYEDNHLLFVIKPVNMPVQEDRTGDPDLLNVVKSDIKERYNKPGNVYVGMVHRLDRPVGGVMVFAKTSKAASRISDVIRKQEMEKKYLAIVRGVPDKEFARLEDYLVKNKKKNIVHTSTKENKEAKRALLDFEVLGTKKGLSLLAITLHTGRPHQIRVQLASRGLPLYGDQKYGENVNKPGEQIALWSSELALPHPTKKEKIRISAAPPNEYPWNLF